MKKLLLVLLAASMIAVPLSACGDNNDTSATSSLSAEDITSAQIITDKQSYNIGDTIKCAVKLPLGNVTACKLVVVPSYMSLSDNLKDNKAIIVLKDFISVSEDVDIQISDNWFAGDCDIRLVSEDGVVALCTLTIADEHSIYGAPQSVAFNNSYIKTDPENIYMSGLRLTAKRSAQTADMDINDIGYAVKLRIDGGKWTNPIAIDKKYILHDDKKDIDKISVISMSKAKNGIATLREIKELSDIFAEFEDILEVTVPSPGNNGIPYVDTTAHSVEVSLCYNIDGANSPFACPIAIGKGF